MRRQRTHFFYDKLQFGTVRRARDSEVEPSFGVAGVVKLCAILSRGNNDCVVESKFCLGHVAGVEVAAEGDLDCFLPEVERNSVFGGIPLTRFHG